MVTAILGGGLTGITLAHLLAEKGEDVIILEKEKEYGGLCCSKTIDGFTFDIGGSHIIFSRDTEVLNFMNKMIDGNKQINIRNTEILHTDMKYIGYPFENFLYQLSDEDRFYCLNEFIKGINNTRTPSNFLDWITHTFGKGIADLYLIPYNEKIWKYPLDQMSSHWVDGRIPRPPVEDIIKSAIGIKTEGYTHQSVFSYPLNGGIKALIDSIASPIKDKIVCNFNVSNITKLNGKFIIKNDTGNVFITDKCISTIPIQHLIRSLGNVPENILNSSNKLKYNSLISVYIALNKKYENHATKSWLYVPDKKLGLFNRISFPSNYSFSSVQEGCSSILAEITHVDGDDVSKMSNTQITDHVIEKLSDIDLINKNDVLFVDVERQKFAYVVYDIDYNKNIKILKDFITERYGIDLLGRFSEFEYLNMDNCIRKVIDYNTKG
ncbi:MAG: FAD-dependent oxidoreductase [Pedobacter sp.]|uniref:protoporphyrinogen/coproporphyrinogen oxidase n=1 Tax=Pedobacter sp. TaxID=1411316 RepID=UPI003565C067